jgi:hypothetical protein
MPTEDPGVAEPEVEPSTPRDESAQTAAVREPPVVPSRQAK